MKNQGLGSGAMRLHCRPLIKEPLNADDWRLVYFACLAFQQHVELIVTLARQRLEAGARE